MPINPHSELQKIWANITTEENVKDFTFDIALHKKLLEIFQVGNYYYIINNVRRPGFDLVSPEIEKVLGYPKQDIDLDFFSNLVHPDDVPFYLNFETAVQVFFSRIPTDKLFKYKVQYDHRLKRADGEYIRVLNQYVIIQHDPENVRTFVVHTDISHLKKDLKPVLSFIGMDGEPSYMDVDVKNIFKPVKHLFTKREKEVLRSLANGLSSAEISKVLSISKHTVDAHRKNMLKKTEAGSTNEVIRIAFDKGWI